MEASPTYEPLEQHPAAARLLAAQPDPVLCRLAARGNVGAYDALYQRYRQPIFAFVFHLLGRADGTEDAEDIVQDAFTRAFAGIREKRVDGAFKAWLFTIARNRTFDLIRARRQKVVSLDADAVETPAAPAVEQPAERAEQRAEFDWLMTAVSNLPERQREALLLREMGGFSHERIAAELGTTVSATKKLIARGRDGIGSAADDVGYGRVPRRKLGRDLAMAAPLLPVSMSAASLGIGAGSVAAGGGAMIGGKAAATALTILAVGGGAVAVKHETAPSAPKMVAQGQGADPRASDGGRQDSTVMGDPQDAPGRREHTGRGGQKVQSHSNSGADGSGRRSDSGERSGDGAHGGSGSGGHGGKAEDESRGGESGGSDHVARSESEDNSGPGSVEDGHGSDDTVDSEVDDHSGSGGGPNPSSDSGSSDGSTEHSGSD